MEFVARKERSALRGTLSRNTLRFLRATLGQLFYFELIFRAACSALRNPKTAACMRPPT